MSWIEQAIDRLLIKTGDDFSSRLEVLAFDKKIDNTWKTHAN